MYTPQQFSIPTLVGLSDISVAEHIKLYTGYVNNYNTIIKELDNHRKSETIDTLMARELHRRIGFEFNGIRNHEYYFQQLEHGPSPINPDSSLYKKIVTDFGSFDSWQSDFISTAMTRGIGWAILSYDKQSNTLMNHFVDEQHIGHLNSTQFIFGIDMWEHAFVFDYQPSGKKQYINDYLTNINWTAVENRLI